MFQPRFHSWDEQGKLYIAPEWSLIIFKNTRAILGPQILVFMRCKENSEEANKPNNPNNDS